MRTENLHYFIEVARTGSITRACETLFISQQNLSAIIKKLELECGYPLFKRHHNGVSLTEYGTLFLQMANTILDANNLFQQQCQELNRNLTGELTIHLVPLTSDVTGSLISSFAQLNPSIRLNIVEGSLQGTIAPFLDPETPEQEHIALLAIPPLEYKHFMQRYPKLNFTLLKREAFFVCVNKSSPLASYPSITMDEFVQNPIISYTAPHGISPFIQELIGRYEPQNIVMTSSNILLCLQATLQGRGAFLLPESAKDNPMFQPLFNKMIHIPIHEDISVFVGYVTHKNAELTPLSSSFITFLRSHFMLT